MKLKDGFVMRTIAGKDIALPSGDELDLNVMITLNETGKYIWKQLETETTIDQIVEKILRDYRVIPDVARNYVEEFIDTLRSHGFIEE